METGATGSGVEIEHEETSGGGAFFVRGATERLAELTYSRSSPQTAVIEHTSVSDALAGQGMGRRLVEAAVEWARRTGTSLSARCTFARSVFDRNPGLRDVLE